MIILGIDIGIQGAIATLDQSGALLDISDMPTLFDGPKGRRAINAPLLAEVIFKSHATHAFVEDVWARPMSGGAVASFTFGRAKGVIEGVLAAAGVPCTFIAPASWKRAVGLAPGRNKDASRGAAIRRWPAQADLFKLKKHDGRSEACLIAIAGITHKQSGINFMRSDSIIPGV